MFRVSSPAPGSGPLADGPRWSRRRFCVSAGVGTLGLAVGVHRGRAMGNERPSMSRALFTSLLLDWCEAMMAHQINEPGDLARHGALGCPACAHLHGRCMDAVYPFFCAARLTGDQRYVAAGKAVMAWAEHNVSQADGSWTVVADPTSWAGISIFGGIALAETLHHHGDLLDSATRGAWTRRLRRGADYVHQTFTIDFTNINYPATAVYGLHRFGSVLNEPAYLAHAKSLAAGVRDYFTSPRGLLFGEGKPSQARSPRGLFAVDLGYNVEESLVALSLYAVEAGDPELEAIVVRSWRAHLAFMLPDGGWDNSWGTRQAKWSYWGSRTCDGCQPGLAVLAHRDATFATAAIRNTELLRACTVGGLLHGGPHYAARGVPPCIHHTFTHAKALATVLDRGGLVDCLTDRAPLPRAISQGVKTFPETATSLVAHTGWRGTVTAYDFVYREDTRQPTGGVLSLLWHDALGPVLAGSMARYVKVEVNNMQDHPDGRDDVLTPRLEAEGDGRLFSQRWDLGAEVETDASADQTLVQVHTQLCDQQGATPDPAPDRCSVRLRFDAHGVEWHAALPKNWPATLCARLILPVIATTEEAVQRISPNELRLHKAGGGLRIASATELEIDEVPTARIFNLTPGFCAIPLRIRLRSEGGASATVRLSLV